MVLYSGLRGIFLIEGLTVFWVWIDVVRWRGNGNDVKKKARFCKEVIGLASCVGFCDYHD